MLRLVTINTGFPVCQGPAKGSTLSFFLTLFLGMGQVKTVTMTTDAISTLATTKDVSSVKPTLPSIRSLKLLPPQKDDDVKVMQCKPKTFRTVSDNWTFITPMDHHVMKPLKIEKRGRKPKSGQYYSVWNPRQF
ncbi:hypothetical protein RMATCC62417_00526 [Rhizopus microsporus]|nr:hypothetical protein RMATCC62417_00526 [Rhizopus microsporus]